MEVRKVVAMDEWITIKTLAVKYITKSKWSQYEENIIHIMKN